MKQTLNREHKNAKAINYSKCESCGKMVHTLYYNFKLKRWECEKCYFKHQYEDKQKTIQNQNYT